MKDRYRAEDRDIVPSGGHASLYGFDPASDVLRARENIARLWAQGEAFPVPGDTLHSRASFHAAYQASLVGASYAQCHARAARRARDERERGKAWRYMNVDAYAESARAEKSKT